ncbi:ATP-binding protein [Methylocapsa acidiphila]|uniref:ATP-binding protein n=1 Tax=Methylocapsa acidiphila TaxID=133552 RepID=UPI000428E9E2|nr:ATP-binding protein [Methylocapsa acidiphila]
MNTLTSPFSIEIFPSNGKRYKSISNLSWENIPSFAILTGKNGSGKTQLLEVLAHLFSGTVPPNLPHLPLEVRVTGVIYSPDEIGYVPSAGRFSGGTPTSLANIASYRQQALQQAAQISSYRHDIASTVRAQKINKLLARSAVGPTNANMTSTTNSDNFEFAISDIDITTGLCQLFVAHRIKILESLERNEPGIGPDGKPLGPPPWQVVNESLTAAGFPYEMISPERTPLLSNYELRLKDRKTGDEIGAIDLSSGEKVLLQLVLWLFTAGREGLFPKLLLLDEPDAHLHPSMTTQFLDVISEVLVNKYGVRVIMTTHSPSTVALAPAGSVFQLERGATSIAKVEVRADIVSVLTAGLVTVSRATKFCFVEDEADVEFYETIRDILVDYGPSQDPMALQPSPSIAFIPVSVGAGTTKVAGGSTVVTKWVNKLDTDPLDRTFFGIIDRDISNLSSGRVYAIGRYSFENYLLDPLVLFALLLEERKAPTIPGVTISSGDEHLLRLQKQPDLQAIADKICDVMVAKQPSLATTETTTVTYSIGLSVQIPKWVVDHRGHDLLPIAQDAFGGQRIVNRLRLQKAMRRCRLVPKELAGLLTTIQMA